MRMPRQILALAYASDERTIGAIDQLNNIRIWRVPDGSEVLSSEVHSANGRRPVAPGSRASFSADLRRAIIVDDSEGPLPNSWDSMDRLWDAEGKGTRVHGWSKGSKLTAAVTSPDGSRYAIGQDDYMLFVGDFLTGKMINGSGAVFSINLDQLKYIPKAAYLPTFLQVSLDVAVHGG